MYMGLCIFSRFKQVIIKKLKPDRIYLYIYVITVKNSLFHTRYILCTQCHSYNLDESIIDERI